MGIPSGYTSAQVVQAVPTGINSALVCVKAETAFSAVASFTADSVFTSTYTNYKIIARYTTSANVSLDIQFRAATVDTTTNYNNQLFAANNTTLEGLRSASASSGIFGDSSNGSFFNLAVMELSGVQLAEPTNFYTLCVRNLTAYTSIRIADTAGNQSASTAFDGIKFLVSSGTTTGTYAIYGYSKTV